MEQEKKLINRTIFCFWFGEEMSPSRSNCLLNLVKNSNVPISYINENNLFRYEIKESPIHPGFKYLSSTHKSDYLRSYFMYFYGGGYSDIKNCNYDWNPYFKILENSEKSFIGYRELSPRDIAYSPASMSYNELVGNGSFIFKEKSKIAKLWLDATNDLMNKKYNELKVNPGTYHPRAITGGVQKHKGIFTDSKYPFRWNELMGQIFHRIQYENIGSFLYDLPYPDTENYR